MAGRKLSDLTPTTSLSENDLVYVVDVSAAAGSKSKGITKSDLAALMGTTAAATQPVENEYADITALLADQGNQTTGFLQYVVDASADPNITSGEAYYEKLATSTATLADDYRLLSDTETEIIKDSNSYRVFRIQDIQDEGTPLTSVSGGKVSFEYSGANVTAILFNKLYTDAIEEFYGKDVSIRFHNRATKRYETEAVASTAWTTVNTDYYRAAVTGTNIQIADLSANNRVEFFIVEAAAGGSSTITESTGTTITFTQDTFWNNLTYLTSGNLTLDLTGAVVGTAAWVWCDRYIPTISGENFIISGVPSTSKLNIYKMVYNGVQTDDYDIDIVVDTKTYLVTPSITITPSNTVNTLSGFTVVNATSYEILSSTTNDIGTASAVSPAYDGTSSTYAHTGLTNGVTHYYWIKAINKSGYLDSDYGTASGASANQSFIFNVTAADSTFVLPLASGGVYNFRYRVDAGSWSSQVTVWNQAEATIALGDTLSHQIEIDGQLEGFKFNNSAQATKIYDVENWGNVVIGTTAVNNFYFFGCTNLTVSATDIFTLQGTASLNSAFKNTTNLSSFPGLNDLDTSGVTQMTNTWEASGITEYHGDWNVESVTTLASYLLNADSFNQPFTNWNPIACVTIDAFGRNCALFNQPIGHLITAACNNADLVFWGNTAFNQDFTGAIVTGLNGTCRFTQYAISTANYDATLIDWGAQTVGTCSVTFTSAKYTGGGAAEAGRDSLVADGWTITDGGIA